MMMKKYFLLLVFFTFINVLVSLIPKIKVEINTTSQSSSIVKAQESPFFVPLEKFELEEGEFKFSVPKQEESRTDPHCISLDGTVDFTNLMIQDINSKYNSGYRLKGFGISSRNPNEDKFESSFTTIDKYIAILCIDK